MWQQRGEKIDVLQKILEWVKGNVTTEEIKYQSLLETQKKWAVPSGTRHLRRAG